MSPDGFEKLTYLDGGSIEVDPLSDEKIDKHSSKLDSDFDAHALSPKDAKKDKKSRKEYTMDDLMKMVRVGNPKEVYSNLHEIGRGSYPTLHRLRS